MGVFLVVAGGDLRARVAASCRSFYMPARHVAVVAYDGSASQLARQLEPLPGAADASTAGRVFSLRGLGFCFAVVAALFAARLLLT